MEVLLFFRRNRRKSIYCEKIHAIPLTLLIKLIIKKKDGLFYILYELSSVSWKDIIIFIVIIQ